MNEHQEERLSVALRGPAKIIPLFKPEKRKPRRRASDPIQLILGECNLGDRPTIQMLILTSKIRALALAFGRIDPKLSDARDVIEERGEKADLLFYQVYRDTERVEQSINYFTREYSWDGAKVRKIKERAAKARPRS